MKNPFKKSSIIDTVVNVGVGGAANVAMDYAIASVDALAKLGDTTKNVVKIALGAVAGSMISNKYARAAFDGIATVGAANLVSGYINGTDDETGGGSEGTTGLPFGTIGKAYHLGQRGFRRRVAGVGAPASAVMSK